MTLSLHTVCSFPRCLTRDIRSVAVLALAALGLAIVASCAEPRSGAPATASDDLKQRSFDTPEDAVVALVDAARTGSSEAVRPLFGRGFDDLESDSTAVTQGDLQRLAAAYDRRHALYVDDTTDDGSRPDRVTLAVGDDLWEFPVPLVLDGSPPRWRFDTAAGVDAVWAMRCQQNESDAVAFLLACIPAQQEYRQLGAGGPGAFAKRFRSQPGTRDGLWWPEAMAPPRSPLGPMADEALLGAQPPIDPSNMDSYLGYRYRVLDAAGPSAPGGATSWLDSSGRLVGGFAFVAWPVEYGRTGIHAILVSMDGTIWRRDLGPETSEAVKGIRLLDPGAGWEVLTAP